LLTTRAPMRVAGGRLFVDVTNGLASPDSRENLLDVLGQSDPLIKDALMTIIQRGDFIKSAPNAGKQFNTIKSNKGMSAADIEAQLGNDPSIASELIRQSQKSIEESKQKIQTKSGAELFDFILEDIQELKRISFVPQNLNVIMAAINAAFWLNEKMNEWLGEINVAEKISQSLPNNITSEMGLELLDVSDLIRPNPAIVEFLQRVKDDDFLDQLPSFEGGQKIRDAILVYLDKYGMRCTGEIDITTTRWSEKPMTLVPLVLSNIKNSKPGESHRKFELGRLEALKKEQELLERLKKLPDGQQKADVTKRMIDLVRKFAGYREYPKYAIVSRYFIYKKALMIEAERLAKAKLILDKEDIFYLSFEELQHAVKSNRLEHQLISNRKDDYSFYEKLTPPRVITSDGEIVSGAYKRENLPAGAIVGLPVSSGVIEGQARVIFSLEEADLDEGDILVTTFTDPSWTALFVSIKGLVTEVGGLMTHGAVIAREYGLPAVVGVENATTLIKDGQRIRVNGTEGYVEII